MLGRQGTEAAVYGVEHQKVTSSAAFTEKLRMVSTDFELDLRDRFDQVREET